MAAESTIAISARRIALTPPPAAGDYYVTTVLLEDGVEIDEARSDEQVTFEDDLAVVSDNSGLYFVGDPSISIAGATLTLNLPGIGNSSTDDFVMQVQVIATDTPRLVSAYEVVATLPGLIALESKEESAAQVTALAFDDPGAGFPYYHVLVFSDEVVHVVHTVQSSETFNTITFSETNVEYLTDSDGDGVADANERLEGTDPGSAASTPGASVIDILAVYNSDVAALYGGDPTTRIEALFTTGNQALADSGVDITINLVDTVQRGYSSATPQATLLQQAEDSLGVFSNLQTLRDNAGADLVVIFLPDPDEASCGIATQGGYPTQGHMARRDHISLSVIDAADCDDLTMMHGIGHNMGLNHSFEQNTSGTFVWSRGHGELDRFGTIMTLASDFDITDREPYFSNPAISLCAARPCGIAIGSPEQANAAATLNIVRFQVARFSAGSVAPPPTPPPAPTNDHDDDGIPDDEDPDDDNDGMPDEWEIAKELNSLVDDASEDPDEDGFTNLQEYNRGSDPQVPDEADACDDPDISAPDADDSTLSFEKRLLIANPGSNTTRQSFIRLINPQATETSVEIYGIDDSGTASKNAPVSLTISPEASIQITAEDLENGNLEKGLTSTLCDLEGKWQLRIRSDQEIEVQGFIRSLDGFLTSMTEVVPSVGNTHEVYFANPASNTNQQSFVRIVNLDDSAGLVTITGVDDEGQDNDASVNFSLDANASLQVTSQDLENGNAEKGLTGSLGDGAGKWRLAVTSDLNLAVMSLLRAPGGFLINMGSVVPKNDSEDLEVYFVSPASVAGRETFLRIINTSPNIANITISGTDDNGSIAPNGDVQLTLSPGASRQMTSSDLEAGNTAKGLTGFFGDGSGHWHLSIDADQSIEAMSLVRTTDGFVTNMGSAAPASGLDNSVFIMNPGSNLNQQSTLRVINLSGSETAVTIAAVDDAGNSAPGGDVTFNLSAGEARNLTAAELESGSSDIAGMLGDGEGKWRVTVSGSAELKVQSLLETPGGYLTNVSETAQ